MLYEDVVYEPIEFKEQVLIDLINSKPLQRLKGISQSGLTMFALPWSKVKTTRFDHSVGVCILLKRFNASLEEQAAGLLHDVSHTVFSHALDFLFNRNTQHDTHEKFYEKIILNSEIPQILKSFDISVNSVLNLEKFTLLEKELPDICVDRIDYYFRDMFLHGRFSKNDIGMMFDRMKTLNSEIIFDDKSAAKFFAEKYMEANRDIWCTPLEASLYMLISDLMRLGISKGVITENDLFTTDIQIIEKLKRFNDSEINQLINLISNAEVTENANDYDFHLKSKVRCVDPKITENGNVVRLSEIDYSYKKKMEIYVNELCKGFFVKIKSKK